jgi:glycosyltransferase involved in cell wall biosynthesis
MILCIQGWLPHYRRDFFNELSRLDDVTVIHSGESSIRPSDRFKEIILPLEIIGPFRVQKGLLSHISQENPSTIVAMFDIHWVNTIAAMMIFDNRINWIWWGLDQGKSSFGNLAKKLIARRNNPIVFYTEHAKRLFGDSLYNRNRLFVANNTFHVPNRAKCFLNPKKNRFLNVGTLDVRKENDLTIRAVRRVLDSTGIDLCLTFIGEGDDLPRLKNLVEELGMQRHVEFTGDINDLDVLSLYYADTIASVSFGQAGLAVLQSMAFGVPFVTKRSAISGGEKYNIVDGENGLLCDDSLFSLETALMKLVNDAGYARTLGRAAYDYYTASASIYNMVEGFSAAIEYGRSSYD